MKKKKGKGSSFILILALLAGVSLLLYPTVSDYWNQMNQSRAIAKYAEVVENLDDDVCDKIWNDAVAYNKALANGGKVPSYDKQLDPIGNGLMGYIEIPALGRTFPIHHGTDDEVLQTAIGHLEWTSLPVGGKNTHCVVSGHRGLPSAKLFTDLDKLREGDLFMLRVLDTLLTYEVDNIRIVKPEETQDLVIEDGKDLCTLVTCTPYGVNTHRLLVRGHRVKNSDETEEIRIVSDAIVVDRLLVALFIGVPLTIVIMIFLISGESKRKNR